MSRLLCGCFKTDTTDDAHEQHAYKPLSTMGNRNNNDAELLVTAQGQAVNLLMTTDELIITKRKATPFGGVSAHLRISKASSSIKRIPINQVLAATCSVSPSNPTLATIQVAAVYRKHGTNKPSKLWTLSGTAYVGDAEHGSGGRNRPLEWCTTLEQRAYQGTKPRRRLRVVINPHGGKGKAKDLWQKEIAPVFKAAGCRVTIAYTGPPNSEQNARNYGRDHKYEDFDVLVSVSGDGIVHELLNGLASRPDAKTALRRTPICPIPAGSGNALQVNLEGPARANDCVWAALAAVKGQELSMDLCSVTQNGQRFFSFLTQAMGLMADLDLGTEHMRWIGELRFTLGYVQGALTRRTYPFEFAIKVADQGTDKLAMVESYNNSLRSAPQLELNGLSPVVDGVEHGSEAEGLPTLRYGSAEDELEEIANAPVHTDLPLTLSPGWHVIRTRIAWAYGGKLPFVSQELKLFPVATGNNGLIDLAIMPPIGRAEALSGMDGADKGSIFFNPKTRYYRCSAVRVKPLNAQGYISIDGEKVQHEPFQVQVHEKLARCMSLSGRFWVDELVVPDKVKTT
ncbi:hypothetical protein ACM66B_005788 [Microbotryomycetes sp. NB124-2]